MTDVSKLGRARASLRGVFWCCSVLAMLPGGYTESREIVGWVERVQLELTGELIRAKVDTGADHSSLDARNIQVFTRDGEEWVRFDVVGPSGVTTTHELVLARTAKIRRHEAASHGRPVVAMGICLGTHYKVTEVNLTDRSRFDNPMLIGRSFLGRDYLVDPAALFLLEPQCERLE